MKNLFSVLLLVCTTLTVGQNTKIKYIYFDTSTTVSAQKSDGKVVLELFDGTISTICMNSKFDNNNAKVICRMMNYIGGSGANTSYTLISSKISTIGNVNFQNIECTGNETTLENCKNFQAGGNSFLCQNHNLDLHVYCGGDYVYNKTSLDISNCNGNLSNKAEGLLSVTSNSITAYFCGINSKFGPEEAKYFCNKTLCSNTLYARIVEGYQSSGVRVIGGFNNISCNSSGCINVYPYQSDRCSPTNNIAVICTNDNVQTNPKPSASCSSTSMTISWDTNTTMPPIANNFLAIQSTNNSNCTNYTVGPSPIGLINLTVAFDTCDMNISGDNSNIYFTFKVIRMFPKINNIITYPDQQFKVSCLITRNITVTQGPLLVMPVALPPSAGNTSIPNELTLYNDTTFNHKIANLGIVAVGTTIFVVVKLINPPPNIILVLNTCKYSDPSITLISNRCPTPGVEISPISSTAKSFRFVLTQSVTASSQSSVACETSKCSASETSCLTAC